MIKVLGGAISSCTCLDRLDRFLYLFTLLGTPLLKLDFNFQPSFSNGSKRHRETRHVFRNVV